MNIENVLKNNKDGFVKKTAQMVQNREVVIKNITSTGRIMEIAKARGIPAGDVFVRITFEDEGKEATASQKLGILKQDGYEKLLKAKADGSKVKVDIDVANEYIYLTPEDVSLDILFNEANAMTKKDTRVKLTDMYAAAKKAADKPAEEPTEEEII